MFEDSLLDSSGLGKTKKPATFAISFLLQSIVLTLVAAIPLIYAEPLPTRALMTFLINPPSPPPPPAPPVVGRPVRVIVKARQQSQVITEPTSIPSIVARIVDPPQPPGLFTGVVTVPGGTGDSGVKSFLENVNPPPSPPPPPQPQPEIIRIGGQVATAKLVSQPKPVYPPLAIKTRTQGTVRLEAVISRDGAIENLTVISGHPLLIPAALDAVRQWRYQPTLLNGTPVEVITTVDVNFTLGG